MSYSDSTDPIGTLKLTIKSATDLPTLETVNIINPYIKASVNSLTFARTIAIPSTFNPDWNESLHLPVTASDHTLIVSVFNAEPTSRDDKLGEFTLSIDELIHTNMDGNHSKIFEPELRTADFSLEKLLPQGTLDYTVAFYPTLGVNNTDFSDTRTISDIPSSLKNVESSGTEREREPPYTEFGTNQTNWDDPPPTNTGGFVNNVHSLEQLGKKKAGVLSLSFIEARALQSNIFVRYLVDEGEFPIYTSRLIRRDPHQLIGETSSAIIRELDYSQITFQVVAKVDKPRPEDVIATHTINTLDLLQNSYRRPNTLTITSDDHAVATITLRSTYAPLALPVKSTESVLNTGLLAVAVVGANAISTKRSSHTTTFARVLMNGEPLLTTQIAKRTVNPAWNESFHTVVLSRTQDKIGLEVYEKGPDETVYADHHDNIGTTTVDLTQLQPGTLTTLTLPLAGNANKGTITVSLLFKPAYVRRRADYAGIVTLSETGMPLAGNFVGSTGELVELDTRVLNGGSLKSVSSRALSEGGNQIMGGAGQMLGAVTIGTGKAVGSAVIGANKVINGVFIGAYRVIGGVIGGATNMVGGTGKVVVGLGGKVGSGIRTLKHK